MPRDSRLYMTFPIESFTDGRLTKIPVEARWTFLASLAYGLGRGTLHVDRGDLALFGTDQHAWWLTRAGLWEEVEDGWRIRYTNLWNVRSRRRGTLPKQLRELILERDGNACKQCGATERLQIDHIYPWSLGGLDEPDNLQVLCATCNQQKAAKV
jgi:5-methylcytosine-specific restriction endonuclease McrA